MFRASQQTKRAAEVRQHLKSGGCVGTVQRTRSGTNSCEKLSMRMQMVDEDEAACRSQPDTHN
eukprot:4194596-Amphidinium_carterae.1